MKGERAHRGAMEDVTEGECSFWGIPPIRFFFTIQQDEHIITILYIAFTPHATWIKISSIDFVLKTRSRYLQGAGPTSGFAAPPSPSSAVSVYPPWCTPAANLPEFQTS